MVFMVVKEVSSHEVRGTLLYVYWLSYDLSLFPVMGVVFKKALRNKVSLGMINHPLVNVGLLNPYFLVGR